MEDGNSNRDPSARSSFTLPESDALAKVFLADDGVKGHRLDRGVRPANLYELLGVSRPADWPIAGLEVVTAG